MKGGGNITDISQRNGVKLITSYWSSIKDTVNAQYSFVGDVHGDLHQFLAPLVLNNIITLTGNIEVKDESISYYIPKYIINPDHECKVIYLGDVTDEWIFSRTISHILYDLLKSTHSVTPDRGCVGDVTYLYGNHDLAIVGRYHLFKQRKLNIAEDLPPLWETLKKELNCMREIKIYKNTILYNGDETEGLNFLYRYLDPLFENLYKIFSERLGKLSLAVSVNGTPYIVSHCTWTKGALKQLLQKPALPKDPKRQSDRNESQLEPIIPNYSPSSESLNYISTIAFKDREDIDYVKLSNSCNDLFNSKSRLFISKNNITYSRNKENIFVNQITGHTIGSEWRELNINVKPSTFNDERIAKLKPEMINGKRIYYFDFGASAGYDRDEISRPDFVYVNVMKSAENGCYVTNLPGFSFITSNSLNDSGTKDSLLVMKDKTPRSTNRIVWD